MGGSGLGVRVDVNEELEICENFVGPGGQVGGVRVDVNEELMFL